MRYPVLLFLCTTLVSPAIKAAPNHFEDTLHDVYEKHPAIRAERDAFRATKQDLPEAISGFLPNVSAGYDRGRQWLKYNDVSQTPDNSTSRQLVVSQPVFNGGESIAQIGEANARIKAGKARLRRVEEQVLLDTIHTYATLAAQKELLALAEENVEVLNDTHAATIKQFNAGEVTISDVSEAEARVARAQAESLDAKNAYENARQAYIRETNLTPSEVEELPPLPHRMPMNEDEVALLAEKNAAVIEAEYTTMAAKQLIYQRAARLLPNARLEGIARKDDGTTTPGLDTSSERRLMLRVSIPIFQSGSEYTQIQRARHNYHQAKNQTLDVTRQSQQIALSAWQDYIAARDALAFHQKAIDAADIAYDSIRAEQLAGTRTVLDVLNVRQELYAARINLTRAKARQITSAYQVLATTGGLMDTLFVASEQSNEVTISSTLSTPDNP